MAFLRSQLLQTCHKRMWAHHDFPSTKTTIGSNTTVYAPSVTDGPMVWEFHKGLTVESGALLTPTSRCKGMTLVVDGDLNVDGIIQMTARGARAAGDNLALDFENGTVLVNPENFETYQHVISATGGGWSGEAVASSSGGWSNKYGLHGKAAGTTYACGGGGNGAASAYKCTARGGNGSPGTSYSGGAGGGGASRHESTLSAQDGATNGGAGGRGYATWNGSNTRFGCGGAGNGGGYTARAGNSGTPYNGGSGTGGLLIIMVNGNVNIGPTGYIQSNGTAGGYASGGSEKAFGGSSGGGSVNILYTGDFNNEGTVRANGGTRSGTYRGGYGGSGTVRISKMEI